MTEMPEREAQASSWTGYNILPVCPLRRPLSHHRVLRARGEQTAEERLMHLQIGMFLPLCRFSILGPTSDRHADKRTTGGLTVKYHLRVYPVSLRKTLSASSHSLV